MIEKKTQIGERHNSPITVRIHTHHWQSLCRAQKSHPAVAITSRNRTKSTLTKKCKKRSFRRESSARDRKTLRVTGVAPRNGVRTASIVRFSRAVFLEWPILRPHVARDRHTKKKRTAKFRKISKKNENCGLKRSLYPRHTKKNVTSCFIGAAIGESLCVFVVLRCCYRPITPKRHRCRDLGATKIAS